VARQVQRQTTQTVCEMVPEQRQISVPVTTMRPVQRTATREVCEMVPTTETRTESFCVMVPYTEQVQVPVAPQAPAPCCGQGYGPAYPVSAPYGYGGGCNDCGGGGRRHGFLHHSRGGCGGCGGC
jgi:hypothetical protein